MIQNVECVVLGAGIIGLAIAREIALSGREVVVLEKNSAVGEEASFRNSAVLRSGVYYSANTLKAKFCREGQALLYRYCEERSVPFKKLGKLIVITEESQRDALQALKHQALQNGVTELIELSQEDIRLIEPSVSAVGGLLFPNTGIVQGKTLLLSLKEDIEHAGGKIVCDRFVQTGEITRTAFCLSTMQEEISCRYLVNAAGLWAAEVAAQLRHFPQAMVPTMYFAKGHYFKLKGVSPFAHLIYPLPESAGLGIHATLDINDGSTRFGPDVEWVERPDYTVSLERAPLFYQAIRRYYPALAEGDLIPQYAGVRPKILPSAEQPQDFVLQDESLHGIKNLMNLYGIESPGLTASMSLAKWIVKRLFQ